MINKVRLMTPQYVKCKGQVCTSRVQVQSCRIINYYIHNSSILRHIRGSNVKAKNHLKERILQLHKI